MGIFDKNFGESLQNLSNNIAGGLNKGFLGAENTNRGLSDAAKVLYDTLDKTAHRTYINNGFANAERTKPNNRNIITQTPEMIVLIKKRMFCSLADNYRYEYMDKEEKHFIRAAKKLFENKCFDISSYEKLTKLNKLIQENQTINSPLAQAIYQTLNIIENGIVNSSSFGFNEISKNRNIIKRIRQLLTLNGFNSTTTWIKDSNVEVLNSGGAGTGVIELTLVKNAQFTTSIEFGQGRGSFSISDPYRLFFIDEADIEKAIFQASTQQFSFINVLTDDLERTTDELKQQLNSLRQARGASTVTYNINISTKIYNRVTVILDRIGLELTAADGSGIDYSKLDNPNVPSFEKFKQEEKDLLDHIYKNIFKILQNKINDFEDFRKFNYDTNNVRKNMRMNFMGKQLIQPMDVVTAFIDSQTVDDLELQFQIKESFLSNSSSIGAGIVNTFGSTNLAGLLSKTVGQLNQLTKLQAEKNILAGPDFPEWIYMALRPNFISQSFGTCVFSGLVLNSSESYSGGVYNVTVNCADNSEYFKQGWIQTKPGLDQFNGYIYDPITPFDFDFDTSTGLLPEISKFHPFPENVQYLNSGNFRFTDGKYAGQTITESKFMDADVEPLEGLTKLTGTYSDIGRKIFNAPDGFVYKWKKGIGTAIINQSGIRDGLMTNRLVQDKLANIQQEDPFGGQDLVNIISIIICGEPYNFNTFLKATIGNELAGSQYTFDPNTDYFQGFMKIIKKQNKVWGNFVPFKKLEVDPVQFGKAISLQLMSFTRSSEIKKKQIERTALLDKLMQIEKDSFSFDISIYNAPATGRFNPIHTTDRAVTFNIIKKIVELDAQIRLLEESIRQSVTQNQINKSVIAIGSNLYYDANTVVTNKDSKKNYALTLAKQNELSKRRIWKVKGNTDQNLFIVGSEYDSDFDIQTLATTISGDIDYINTSWQQPFQKLKEAVDVIGLELFANSQGHIELRAPRYNRIPSSILYSMLKKKKEYNIQIYPDFLEKLFNNKINAVFDDIEIIEDQIRLRAIALGANYSSKKDDNIELLLNGTKGPLISGENGVFQFVTDNNGKLTSMRKAVSELNNETISSQKDNSQKGLKALLPINISSDVNSQGDFFSRKQSLVNTFKTQSDTFNNFDIIQQNQALQSSFKIYSQDKDAFFQNQTNQAQEIRTRLAAKLGLPLDSASIKTIPQLLPNSKNGKLSAIDVNTLIRELDGLISQRYEDLLNCVNLIKSLDQASKVNSQDSDIFQKLLLPNLYNTEDIPEFLRNMIENELEDDYGVNSGKRFVIKESDIVSMNYREDKPEFTSIHISGSELGGLASGPGGFQIANAGTSRVWAVDYDLWRMYGAAEATGKNLPFISNAELQLAPYAVFLLNQQRANIFRGDVTIKGNESVQPGEVYYIQERGMLFYSKDVTHNFSYGEEYKTTINLTYGHVPGEYIPTPLDVIGKNVYNGHYLNSGNYRVSRPGTTATNNSTHIDTMIFPKINNSSLKPEEQLYSGDEGERNRQIKASILAKINLLLDTVFPQENRGMRALTVRIYSNNSIGEVDTIYKAAKSLVNDLINNGLPRSSVVGKGFSSKDLIPADVMYINLNEPGTKNPSSLAISYCKEGKLTNPNDYTTDEIKNLTNSSNNDNYKIIKTLANNIIDIWLDYDIIPNENIIKAASIQSTNPNGIASTGKNPNNSISSQSLENMREAFKNIPFEKLIQ